MSRRDVLKGLVSASMLSMSVYPLSTYAQVQDQYYLRHEFSGKYVCSGNTYNERTWHNIPRTLKVQGMLCHRNCTMPINLRSLLWQTQRFIPLRLSCNQIRGYSKQNRGQTGFSGSLECLSLIRSFSCWGDHLTLWSGYSQRPPTSFCLADLVNLRDIGL